jgi:hypothetical protein
MLDFEDLKNRERDFLYFSPGYTGQLSVEMQIRKRDLAESVP